MPQAVRAEDARSHLQTGGTLRWAAPRVCLVAYLQGFGCTGGTGREPPSGSCSNRGQLADRPCSRRLPPAARPCMWSQTPPSSQSPLQRVWPQHRQYDGWWCGACGACVATAQAIHAGWGLCREARGGSTPRGGGNGLCVHWYIFPSPGRPHIIKKKRKKIYFQPQLVVKLGQPLCPRGRGPRVCGRYQPRKIPPRQAGTLHPLHLLLSSTRPNRWRRLTAASSYAAIASDSGGLAAGGLAHGRPGPLAKGGTFPCLHWQPSPQ